MGVVVSLAHNAGYLLGAEQVRVECLSLFEGPFQMAVIEFEEVVGLYLNYLSPQVEQEVLLLLFGIVLKLDFAHEETFTRNELLIHQRFP